MVHLKWCLENVLVGTGKHHGDGVVTQVALVRCVRNFWNQTALIFPFFSYI